MNKWMKVMMASALVAATAGCASAEKTGEGNAGTNPAAQVKGPDMSKPITLTMYQRYGNNDDEFKKFFQDPLSKVFPNVTLQLVRPKSLDELLTAGQIPDIIQDWNGNFTLHNDNGLLQDMTPLLKKHNIDIGQFDQAYINALQTPQMLQGIPLFSQFNALYYNKDIFDKFGVPYPKDGMTWEETLELGKKLTRNVDGVQYTGLNYDEFNRLHMPFSISMIDSKTGKANVGAAQWKEIFELGYKLHNIGQGTLPTGAGSNFPKLTVAMAASVNMLSTLADPKNAALNWDIAQFPQHRQLPNVANQVDIHALFVPKGAPHPEEAMEVIKALTSKEIQTIRSKDYAQMTVLADPAVKNTLGQNVPYLKGKNIEGIMKSKVSPYPTPTKYDGQIRNIIKKYFNEYAAGKIPDVNSALRQAQEEADKYLEQKK